MSLTSPSAPSSPKVLLALVVSFLYLRVLSRARRKSEDGKEGAPVHDLGLMSTWLGLWRNLFCCIKDVFPDLFRSLLPSADGLVGGFTPMQLLVAPTQYGGMLFSLYMGLGGFLRARAEKARLARWLVAARSLDLDKTCAPAIAAAATVDGPPAPFSSKAALVELQGAQHTVAADLEAAVKGASVSARGSMCKCVLGGGMFYLGSFTLKWCKVDAVVYAITGMLSGLALVLRDWGNGVAASQLSCEKAQALAASIRRGLAEGRAFPTTGPESTAVLVSQSRCSGLLEGLEPALAARVPPSWAAAEPSSTSAASAPPSIDDMQGALLDDCKRMVGRRRKLVARLNNLEHGSAKDQQLLAAVEEACKKTLAGASFERTLIRLNWAALVGYLQILITFYVDEVSMPFFWPGHDLMGDAGNFLGDVCWTVEPMLVLFT
jgi:hypothetical protein